MPMRIGTIVRGFLKKVWTKNGPKIKWNRQTTRKPSFPKRRKPRL